MKDIHIGVVGHGQSKSALVEQLAKRMHELFPQHYDNGQPPIINVELEGDVNVKNQQDNIRR